MPTNDRLFFLISQKICSEDQFKCESGTCIDIKWKCDEEDDCRDGSDEKGCIYETCKGKCLQHLVYASLLYYWLLTS